MKLLPDHVPQDNYRMTGSLADVRSWKARIISGNSMTEEARGIGDWDEVGYVMIAMTGPVRVIPIARSDEHHRGADLLHDMAGAWRIDPRDFFPVYSAGTGVYLYSGDEIPTALKALERWFRLGGPDVLVTSPGGNGLPRWKIGGRDFLDGKGTPVCGADGLLPLGQRLVDALARVRDAVAALRDPADPRVFHDHRRAGVQGLARAANAAVDLIQGEPGLLEPLIRKDLQSRGYGNGGFQAACRAWLDRCARRIGSGDTAEIEDLFFGHDRSVKNTIHMAVRAERAGKGSGGMADIMGDLDLADAALGRISPGLLADTARPDGGAPRSGPGM